MRIKCLLAMFGLFLFTQMGAVGAAEPTGAAQCVKCHDAEERPDISKTAHGFSSDQRVPDCISCHGASDDHANNRRQPGAKGRPGPDRMFDKASNTPASQRSEACLTCHTKDAKRALWSGSQHDAADVACSACHVIHNNQDKVRNRATQAEVCYTCHKEQRSQVNKASHHPIPEGKVTCSDCHNVHGSAGPKLVKRDSINDTCYTCHAEKRGPYIRPHDPVTEDCANCHNSHGSNTAGLLKVRAPLLCQECHTTTTHAASTLGSAPGGNPGINAAGIWQGRSCMNCHTQVHGSNNPTTNGFSPKALMR